MPYSDVRHFFGYYCVEFTHESHIINILTHSFKFINFRKYLKINLLNTKKHLV